GAGRGGPAPGPRARPRDRRRRPLRPAPSQPAGGGRGQPCRDRRPGRRRYRVWSARGGIAGPGDAVSPARAARRGARDARRDPGLGGGAQRRPVRGVALGAAPGGVRGDLRDDGLAGLRAAVGGDVTAPMQARGSGGAPQRFWARRGTVVLGGLTVVSLAVLVALGL